MYMYWPWEFDRYKKQYPAEQTDCSYSNHRNKQNQVGEGEVFNFKLAKINIKSKKKIYSLIDIIIKCSLFKITII